MNTAKTTVLSGFWQKNGLGPLGVTNPTIGFLVKLVQVRCSKFLQ